MNIKYICPYWGYEGTAAGKFLEEVLLSGYDGIEINLPDDAIFTTELLNGIKRIKSQTNPDFVFIAQQVLPSASESVAAYTEKMCNKLEYLSSLRPDFINAHTGKDYFGFDENCNIIHRAEAIATKTGIPVLHEIHRGRFTFHAKTLLPYLMVFPDLKLTGDFSHWCTVSESMLQDQPAILEAIFPHVKHLHARIGFEQGPQVNDPFAPEWESHCEKFIVWWKQVLEIQKAVGNPKMTITPEFGPKPYMPMMPYTCEPLCDQHVTNHRMKQLLKTRLAYDEKH
ncbi:sugar phosphate isomerase/epimerase [Flavobacterium sp.]|uniref:sugar phosphate isomerase/epimerase n=1 Tax=Flavobacterium sp. TaxID=239 RepID=UPI0026120CE9|nr:sugar phosphate isomerase/epimerase [Flavobacterium sp.]